MEDYYWNSDDVEDYYWLTHGEDKTTAIGDPNSMGLYCKLYN